MIDVKFQTLIDKNKIEEEKSADSSTIEEKSAESDVIDVKPADFDVINIKSADTDVTNNKIAECDVTEDISADTNVSQLKTADCDKKSTNQSCELSEWTNRSDTCDNSDSQKRDNKQGDNPVGSPNTPCTPVFKLGQEQGGTEEADNAPKYKKKVKV